MSTPPRLSRMMPTSAPLVLDDPLTCMVHHSCLGSWCCRSFVKSTKHCALMGPCGSYLILNLDSLTDQDESLLARSGF